MTHDELNSLWRKAGCPWVAGMVVWCGNMVSGVFGSGGLEVASVDRNGSDLEQCTSEEAASLTPDWSHPMTEFAMMCAAEQAAGARLCWLRYNDDGPDEEEWGADDHCHGSSLYPGGPCYSTRIECALRVIIACREAG